MSAVSGMAGDSGRGGIDSEVGHGVIVTCSGSSLPWSCVVRDGGVCVT